TKSKFKDESYTNPYRDLTSLYIDEAKFPEAISALQKTNEWSRSLRPYLYQQNMAEETQLASELLLELGFVPEAIEKLKTLLNRPDREGGSSSDVDQGEGGNLLTWYTALNVQRECYREAVSWLHGWPYFKAKFKIIALNYEMWRTSSRLRAIMAENDRIAASMRPYCSQSIASIEAYKPLLVRILGAGTCATALSEISRKAPENFPVEEPFILVNKAEVAYNLGNYDAALKNLEKADLTLPKVMRLERSIVEARLAQLYRRNGNLSKSLSLYSSLISSTPTAIRHMNCKIPIKCVTDNSQASKLLVKYLKNSPRFEVGSQGLVLNIYKSGENFVADLSDSNQRILSTAKTKITMSNRDTASNLAAEIHNQVFATKINLSSININSLDGSNSSGSMARKNFQKLFGVEDKPIDNLDDLDSYQYDNT
ncbi:hypothetical protein IJT10_05335, partial [bacterium]|nr:hypothetical protein [bacterium]